MRVYYAYTKRFTKNQRLLKLVWGPGDAVISLILWKMREKADISETRLACSVYYYAKLYKRYAGPLCLYETH